MFYCDLIIKDYEKNFSWNKSLLYLEKKFKETQSVDVLNSLVGFSWYYLIEGPIESKKYNDDDNAMAFDCWHKYVFEAIDKYINDDSVCFILGYTLLLHGYLLPEYHCNNESIGILLIKKASESNNKHIKAVSNHVLKVHDSEHIQMLNDGYTICKELFGRGFLLADYFCEIFTMSNIKT